MTDTAVRGARSSAPNNDADRKSAHPVDQLFQVIFGSSITSTVIVVFVLNLFFNHWKAWPPKNTALRVALGDGAVTGVTDEDLAAHSGQQATAATAATAAETSTSPPGITPAPRPQTSS